MAANPITILAIDDNPDNLISIKAVVKDAFAEANIITATNGPKGIKLAISENPDLIMLDIVMPEMDGYEVCKQLKATEGLESIPVIFLTALKTDRDSRLKAIDAGGDAFLAKPIDMEELTAQVRAMLKVKAANLVLQKENKQLNSLVAERTANLEKELAAHVQDKCDLKLANERLCQQQKATLNLLEDLKEEIRTRKKMEEALREGESRYNALFEQESVGVAQVESNTGRFIRTNQRHCDIVGYSANELLATHFQSITHPDDLQADLDQLHRLMAGEIHRFVMEKRYIRKDGQIVWANLSVLPLWRPGEKPDYHFSIIEDITERKKAQANYQMLFREMIDGFALHQIICDETGCPVDYRFLAINPAFEKLTGLKAENLIGRTVMEVMPQTETFWIETYGEVALTGKPAFFEHFSEVLQRHYEISAFCPTPGQFACIFVDKTEKHRQEELLINSERRLRLALAAGEMGTWDWNIKSGKIIWSEGHARLFGMDPENTDVNYALFKQSLHPEDIAVVESAIEKSRENKTEYRCEFRVQWPDHSIHWILGKGHYIYDEQGQPIRMLGVVQDITSRKSMEAQLLQAQKMEAVGQLAGGIAHDFNNILAAILMHLSLMRQDSTLKSEMRDGLIELEKEARRAASLTRQLLLYSRRSVMQIKTLDANEVIDNLMKMLRRLLGEHINLRIEGYGTPLWIDADPGMIEQVLMNLCVNARDAMPNGGKLTITTRHATIDSTVIKCNPEARPGCFACVEVTDTGCGMDAHTLDHVFEPFFTTKEVGKGTGLGLATVYGIIKQHNGWMEVQSAIGKGTTFRFFIPIAPKSGSSITDDAIQALTGGNETILLVEDEITVRKATTLFIRRLGYAVVEAGSGAEALIQWSKYRNQIALLYTDMVMPEGMTGLELAEQLRKEKPQLAVIISSGYSTELPALAGHLKEGIIYVPKPCLPANLQKLLREALDQKKFRR